MAGFIGPEGPTCHTAAMVAGSKNRAMIAYKCSDAEVSDKEKFPTFIRMEPPDTRVTESVFSLLTYYNWWKFSIICQEGPQFETIAKHLESTLPKNFTINDFKTFKDFSDHKVTSKRPHDILKETKDRTRIYVFLGKLNNLLYI